MFERPNTTTTDAHNVDHNVDHSVDHVGLCDGVSEGVDESIDGLFLELLDGFVGVPPRELNEQVGELDRVQDVGVEYDDWGGHSQLVQL